jgi:hypothetical protein
MEIRQSMDKVDHGNDEANFHQREDSSNAYQIISGMIEETVDLSAEVLHAQEMLESSANSSTTAGNSNPPPSNTPPPPDSDATDPADSDSRSSFGYDVGNNLVLSPTSDSDDSGTADSDSSSDDNSST